MTLEQAPSQGRRIAFVAVSGLLAGLPACAGSANNEVVVDPTPPVNTGSALAVAAATAEPTAEAQTTEDPPDQPKPKGRRHRATAQRGLTNCCAGKNSCKGLGGCKTDRHDCRGKNECKGMGGCQVGQCEANMGTVAPPPPIFKPRIVSPPASTGPKMCCKGMNDCKGKGNCKTNDNACAGQNDCKGKGGCKGPC